MALNNEFKVKNDLNTLGRILSGGTDILTIFSPSNTSWTLSANNGTFGVAGGDTLSVQGGNGVDVRVATGTDTVRISGIDATTSVKGVASFNSASFAVTNGDVTIKSSGVSNAQLAGSITDDKLSTISTASKVSNSATTATSSNTANAIVARGASGEFSSGSITATGNLSASGSITGNSITGNSIVASNITATNVLSAANTFTRQLSVGNVQVRTVGTSNVFLGDATTGRDAATGVHNFVFGLNAGSALTVGGYNNFLGNRAGLNNTCGSFNNFLGYYAGSSNTGGFSNNFLGFQAGGSNTTGGCNNFLGARAGGSSTTGSGNNFLGFQAGKNNTTGGHNNFFGIIAGYCNTTGAFNNFLGFQAGGSNTTGSCNNFLGNYAGCTNTIGSNNTIIGNAANVATNSLSGVIVLGRGAIATESHQIVLSTANVSFKSTGNIFEIGTPNLTDNLTVYGAVSSTGIVNTNTGFRISNGATSGHVLRGNGTNFISSTLAASDIASGQALTKTDDTNVTLNLGGSPSTALLTAASLTLGWSGQLALSRGGTNASTAQGAINNLAGGVTSGQYLRGNGTNIALTGIQVSDVPTLNQNTTGSAATLTTTRTLWGQNFNGSANVTGNLTSVGSISGTGGIDIYTGASGSNISLTTTGTGDIQLTPGSSGGTVNIPNIDLDGGTINGTTIGLTVPASGVFTGVNVTGNVTIDGNLFVAGSATRINTTDLIVKDPIIFLAEGNLNDSVDIGFTAAYNHSLTPPRHTGFIRDHITKEWTLFSNLSTEILSAIDIPLTDPSVQIDTLNANIKGTLTGNVSGTALRANQFTTARIISATGDISYSSGSFDGSANVTGTATINNNAVTTAKILNSNVTYAKIQNVSATDRILGRSSAGAGVIEEITCTAAGRALLDDASASAQRTTLGVGTTDSVTFGEVIVNNGTKSVLSDVYNTTTATNVATLSTFANASYNSAKYTVQIKNTSTSARCALEIIASKNNTTWEGTVYGIVDPANLFTNVDITAGPTAELVFTLNGVANYAIVAYAQAISD